MNMFNQHTAQPSSVQRRTAGRRRGTVMTEFVIVAPLLFLFFFGAFEFCRVAMIRSTADNAVYEGARVAIVPGATANDARQEAERILSTIGLVDVDIDVEPSKIKKDTTEVTVRVKVPLDKNSFVPNQFVNGKSIVRELTMRREGIHFTFDVDGETVKP